MPIRVETNTQKPKPSPKYPCLMRLKDGYMVVLFFDDKHGTVLMIPQRSSDGYPYEIGQHLVSWNIGEFVTFDGSITLSNE